MSTSTDSVSYTDIAHRVDPAQIPAGVDPLSDDAEIEVKYPWNGGAFPPARRTWGDEHDIHTDFLPFAYLDVNPIEVLTKVGDYLDSRPETRQRVSTSDLVTQAGLPNTQPGPFAFEDVCLLRGWWKGGETPTSGVYYCNPDYVHGHGDDDYLTRDTYWDDDRNEYVNERFDLAHRAAQLGLTAKHVRAAYGPIDPTHWLADRNFRWSENRREGMRTMARTFETLLSWGYVTSDIADAFGVSGSVVRKWTSRYAPDFEPPADPSYRVMRND